MRLSGIGVSSGRACAPLVVLGRRAATLALPPRAEPLEARRERLDLATATARAELAELEERTRERLGDDAAAIVAVQLAFLDDPELVEPIRERLEAGAAPEAAVHEATEELASALAALDDQYLSERDADVRDVGRRLVGALGQPDRPAPVPEHGEMIVAAHDLTPTDTLGLDADRVRGIVTEIGGRTSHMAILARGLGIPAVVGVAGLLDEVRPGVLAAIDGDDGAVHVPPGAEVEREFTAARDRDAVEVRTAPGALRDGVSVAVLANCGSPAEVRRAVALGADGVGLYRTELLFLAADHEPTEDEQAAVYAEAAAEAGGRPITFRTLDIGGDKSLPALGVVEEPNAFLGVRGIRLSLRRPELLGAQLRALARVARRYDNVRVMVPMVSIGAELREVRAHAEEAGLRTPIGAMIEVPVAALGAGGLCREADFLSVGTNDLTQYLFAVDRTSPALGDLYQELHPLVLGVLHDVATAAGSAGRSAGVCGEMASQPGVAVLLAGLGYRQLSVVASAVPTAKAALAARTLAAAERLAERALESGDAEAVAALLTA